MKDDTHGLILNNLSNLIKNRMKSRITFLIVVFGILSFAQSSWADTHYVCDTISTCNGNGGEGWSGTPADSETCGSKDSPCKTISYGLSQIAGGDTLIIGNGTYTGSGNHFGSGGYNMGGKDGSQGHDTVIRSDIDFNVTIDMQGDTSRSGLWLNNANHVLVQGFYFKNGGHALVFSDSSYAKGYRCLSEEMSSFHYFVHNNSHHNLFEECTAWGRGTYFFNESRYWDDPAPASPTQYNIFRRCLVRRDAHFAAAGGNHYASFTGYQNPGPLYVQNCVSIDSEVHRGGQLDTDPYTNSAFYGANGVNNFHIDHSLVINDAGGVGQHESGASNVTYDNVAAFMPANGTGGINFYGNGSQVTNSAIYGLTQPGEYTGIAISQWQNITGSVKNNIIFGNRVGFFRVNDSAHDYNLFYGNSINFGEGTLQPHENTIHDPLTSGLLYPTRIESSSWLKTAGENGTQLGPTILTKMGTPLTLFGEDGWDADTGQALWPWPNEEILKERMQTYNLHGANGARGFAAPGNGLYGGQITLTSYIWEFLGNPCPTEICNYSHQPDITPPTSPTGLIVN